MTRSRRRYRPPPLNIEIEQERQPTPPLTSPLRTFVRRKTPSPVKFLEDVPTKPPDTPELTEEKALAILEHSKNFSPYFINESTLIGREDTRNPHRITIELEARPKPKIWYEVNKKRDLLRLHSEERRVLRLETISEERNRYIAILEIDVFSPYDNGEYTFHAQNSVGKGAITVPLIAWPDHEEKSELKLRLLKGPIAEYTGLNSHKLSVIAWSPNFMYTHWFKYKEGHEMGFKPDSSNGDLDTPFIKITNVEIIKNIYEFAFILKNARPEDEATYRCTIVDAWGRLHFDFPFAWSKSVNSRQPKLFCKPKIFSRKSSRMFAFIVLSEKEPKYTWIPPTGETFSVQQLKHMENISFKHNSISFTSGEKGFEGVLTIKYLAPAEKGEYTCRIENQFGTIDVAFVLKEPPKDEMELAIKEYNNYLEEKRKSFRRPRPKIFV